MVNAITRPLARLGLRGPHPTMLEAAVVEPWCAADLWFLGVAFGMLLIHGTYHWKPKRVAFRADYCRSCQASRLSVLIRTIDVFHLFWLPILPLGTWSRWFCGTCGHRPHQSTRTRRGFKVAGAIVLALFSAVVWMPLPEADEWILWLLRVVLPLLTVVAIASALRAPLESDLKARLAQVAEFRGWICPLCGGDLFHGPTLCCLRCHADHRPLPHRPAA